MLNKIKKIICNSSFVIRHFTEYFFYLFLFLFPWQTQLILRQGLYKEKWPVDYWTIGIFGVDILLVGLLILFSLSLRAKRSSLEFLCNKDEIAAPRFTPLAMTNGLLIILVILDLSVFFSIFFAPDKILSLYKYFTFSLGIGLFWLIIKLPFNKIKAAYAFFGGLVLQGSLAVWQFFNQYAFGNKWLGMAEHLALTPGTSVIETVGADGEGERWLRAYGSFSHPNILGGVMAFGLILLTYLFIKDNSKNRKITNYFLFFVLFLGLLFSFSRTAYLSFFVGFLMIFISELIKKNWLAIKRLGGIFLLLVIIFGAIFLNYQNLFITRVGGAERLEVKSSSERQMYLEDSFRMLKNNWFRPRGVGNYTKALIEENKETAWYYFHPVHNVFLLAWLEIGPFGLLFFLIFLAYLFWQSFKSKNILGLSILVMLCIMMALDHWLWSIHFGIFFFLVSGIIFKINNQKQYEI